MPFDAATLGFVEEALCEGFKYHNALDQFLTRSGLAANVLIAARMRADDKASASARREFSRAPKRYVVQEILTELANTSDGDRTIATIVTGLVSGAFADATPAGLDAIEALKKKRANDASEVSRKRDEEKAEHQRKALEAERVRSAASVKTQLARDSLRDRFINLMSETNAQRRGYLLEIFLNDLFAFENLDPRASFKMTGEQIDGSFLWRSRTSLVEAKWVKDPIAGAEFGAFIYKIDGKTADTRGIYISINGYSREALLGLKGKGALKFVCLDGTHLFRVLAGGESLPELLEKLWRHADETGDAYFPANKMI